MAAVEPAAVAAAGGAKAAALAVARFAAASSAEEGKEEKEEKEEEEEEEEYFFASLVAREALFLLVAVCCSGEEDRASRGKCAALLLLPPPSPEGGGKDGLQVLEGVVKLLLLPLEEEGDSAASVAGAALDVLSLAMEMSPSDPQRAAEALRAAGAEEALRRVVGAPSASLPPTAVERARELLSLL